MKLRFSLALLATLVATLAHGQMTASVQIKHTNTGAGIHTANTAAASVTLNCAGPTTGTTPTSFNLYRSTTSGSGYLEIDSSATCSFTDAAVNFGTTYYYVATSLVATGTGCPCESTFSNQATAVVPANPTPLPPTNLTVGTITASIPMNWQAPAGDPVYAYRVYRMPAGGTWTMVASGLKATTWTDHVAPGTYNYEVIAVYDNGKVLSVPSNVQEITVE